MYILKKITVPAVWKTDFSKDGERQIEAILLTWARFNDDLDKSGSIEVAGIGWIWHMLLRKPVGVHIGERKKNITNFLLEELAGIFHRYGKPGNGGQ